jgi:diguanylate cyclase (GGDEF)-like protein
MKPKLTKPAYAQTMTLTPMTFRWLLLFGVFCFCVIWMVDAIHHHLSDFDSVAYPVCIAFLVVVYFLSIRNKFSARWLHLLTYVGVSTYLISSSIWHHMMGDDALSNAAQWLGLNYVIAYLFLGVKKAVPTTLVVFAVTLFGHYIVLIHQYSASDTLGLVIHMGVSHMVYIVLLWMVLRIRVERDQELQRANQLEYYVHMDPLTRVLNRRGLENALRDAEIWWQRERRHYAILIIDIDHFKQINDRFGHLVGDRVLVELSKRISHLHDRDDVFGRWGGEEFLILTRSKTHQEVLSYAEYFRDAINLLKVGEVKQITASIGISYSEEAETSLQVLNIADKNLYAAKHSGRNQIMDTRMAEDCAESPVQC